MPWVGLNITSHGHLTPCCAYQDSNNDTRFTLAEYDQWRTEFMQPLKESLLAGQKPECCNQCWKLEAQEQEFDVNLSERLIYNKKLGTHWAEQSNPPVKFISVAFGTTCNLRCNHCGPYSSSSWATEIKQNPQLSALKTSPSYEAPEWFEQQNNISKLDQISDQVEHIRLIGGEQLFSTEALRYMEQLPVSAKLNVITNATQLKPRVLELLSKFQELDILVSIDGVGSHAEYVRYPSKWQEVEHNILTLKSLPNIGSFCANYVLQHYSRWTLIPTIQWCMDNEISLRVQPLLYIQYLSINGMQPEHCQQLMHELDQFVEKNQQRLLELERRIPFSYLIPGIRTMLQEQYQHSQDCRQKFIDFHTAIDAVRGLSFHDYFRET